MARRKDNLLEDIFSGLMIAPWWFGPILAGLLYGVCKFFGRNSTSSQADPVAGAAAAFFNMFAFPILIIVLCIWVITLLKKGSRIQLFNRQTGIQSIRRLTWEEFEWLSGELFRREGYGVEERGGRGGDGGVDLEIYKNGETTLVQCKHWEKRQVGIKVVRELLGAMSANRTNKGILVTSGRFTQEAKRFARRNGIRLIDGSALDRLHRDSKGSHPKNTASSQLLEPKYLPSTVGPAASSGTPICPRCGTPMVIRTAKKGEFRGKSFYGCSNYPRCKQIIDLNDA